MSRSEENYNHLIQKIDGFIRKFYLNMVVKGIIILMSSFFTAYVIVAIAEYLGNFEPEFRTALFYGFIGANLFVLFYYIVLPLLAYFKLGSKIDHKQASVIIGNHFQPIKDKLLNTLQLKTLSELHPEQRQLINASIDQKVTELRPVPFSSAIRFGENKRFIKFALIPLGLIIFLFFGAPSILNESTVRLINYDKRFVKKAPFSFSVENKSLTALQGEDFILEVKLSGEEIPSEIYLEDGQNTFKLQKDNTVSFSYTFKNIQKTKTIRLKGSDFYSEEYLVKVIAKPALLDFSVKLEFPGYLEQPSTVLHNTGDLTVPSGTRITWSFRAANTDQLSIGMAGANHSLSASPQGTFNFSHRALKNQDYTLQPANALAGQSDPVKYQLRVVPDMLPAIDVVEKSDSLNSRVLYFAGQVNDDHGFTKLTFNYRIIRDREKNDKVRSKALSFNRTALQSNFVYLWNTADIKAQEGDEIEYYFEVSDNDQANGPKSSRTAVKTLKPPTAREVEKQIEVSSDQLKNKMSDAIRKAAQLEKEAKRLNQSLLDRKSLTYDEKKQIQNLLDKQKELDKLVQDIQKQNKKNIIEQEQNQQLTEEILEKQKQIENLFNNVLDEKTRELLKNIEKLLEQNNKNQTQEELSKMQMDSKSLQKELDRILELYKNLEFEQKLESTIDNLEKLAGKQQDLSEKSALKNDFQTLTKEQTELQKQLADIKQDLNELAEKNEELERKNEFEMPERELEQIEDEQSKSAQNLKKKDQKQAAENQRSAADRMKKLADKLDKLQDEGEEQENQINAKALREILENLLTSSFDQERTMQAVKATSPSDPGYGLQTQKQREIKDNLKMIEDSLYSLSKKVPQIQSVVNKEVQTINHNITKAIDGLSERRTPEANRHQQLAMTSINNLALMLNEALDQLQEAMKNAKPGSKGKGKPSLSQLTKMQEQLNKNMQKAREQMQGQPGPQKSQRNGTQPGMSEQLSKMAREQQMIRQAMQELNRLENKDGNGKLGNLDQLVKDMEQTETDLVNKKIQQETISRQRDILTKLLNAEKAERERDQDEKRESKEGQFQSPDYKIILQEYQKIKQKETELLKTVPPGLNSFYKIKVGDYFKNLNSGYK